MYHGTSLENIRSIQENGFKLTECGKAHGAQLGKGIYLTPDLTKALTYAGNDGGVLVLSVTIERCYTVRREDRNKSAWQRNCAFIFGIPYTGQNYDSAFAGEGALRFGSKCEYCIKDPSKGIEITNVIL